MIESMMTSNQTLESVVIGSNPANQVQESTIISRGDSLAMSQKQQAQKGGDQTPQLDKLEQLFSGKANQAMGQQ